MDYRKVLKRIKSFSIRFVRLRNNFYVLTVSNKAFSLFQSCLCLHLKGRLFSVADSKKYFGFSSDTILYTNTKQTKTWYETR